MGIGGKWDEKDGKERRGLSLAVKLKMWLSYRWSFLYNREKREE